MKIIEIPQMIQIGSTGRNSGKTMLAKKIIKQYHEVFTIYGLKIITITGSKGKCQRGEIGCGICTSIDTGFELVEETDKLGDKDTMQLLRAGCKRVFLLKVFHDCLSDGFQAFLEKVPLGALIICESNSLREIVRPNCFIMMHNKTSMKKTAKNVINEADMILEHPVVPDLKQYISD